MCRHTPLASCFAIHGQKDCRTAATSVGRSGRGVETTRNSMMHLQNQGSAFYCRQAALVDWYRPRQRALMQQPAQANRGPSAYAGDKWLTARYSSWPWTEHATKIWVALIARRDLMRKLTVNLTATAAILAAGAMAWQAQAQTFRAATILGSAIHNFTPVEKAQPAACRGWGRRCPPGRVWTCGPRGCWCRWC